MRVNLPITVASKRKLKADFTRKRTTQLSQKTIERRYIIKPIQVTSSTTDVLLEFFTLQ